jgi:hypothetical protein
MPTPIRRVSLSDQALAIQGQIASVKADFAAGRMPAVVALDRTRDLYSAAMRAGLTPDALDAGARISDPMQPMQPAVTTPDAPPRLFPVMSGRNVQITPRSEDARLSPFTTLRALAESHGGTRAVIQSIRSSVVSGDWTVAVRDEFADAHEKYEPQVTALRTFFEVPDRVHPWDLWLSKLIDELLVTDSVTLVPRRDRAGRMLALQVIDGATIKPIVDILGQTPLPPDVAYQQIILGRPETQFASDQLLYRPKNTRSWTPYGQSPVEMIALIINLAIRRELHYLAWYTSGTIPDAIYGTPSNWTDMQIAKFQKFWDDSLRGDSDRRAGGLLFVPGGDGAGYTATKNEEWRYEFDEYIARVIAYAFGVSPLWVAKQVNRASAGQMDRSQNAQGYEPVKRFIAARINEVIRLHFRMPQIEFQWTEEREENQALDLDEDTRLLAVGERTINEVRTRRGEARYAEDWADEPFVMTAGGPVLLRDAFAPKPEPKPMPPALVGQNTAGAASPAAPATTLPGAPQAPPAPEDVAVKADLSRWRKIAIKDVEAGRPVRAFVTNVIPAMSADALRGWLAKAGNRDQVEAAFAKVGRRPTPASVKVRAQRDIKTAVRRAFSRAYKTVVPWAVAKLNASSGAAKAAQDDPLAGVDWDALVGELADTLETLTTAGAQAATNALGLEWSEPPKNATAYAHDRAAELVGKKWVGGDLVDNPNPRWAITETVREDINRLVASAIEEGWGTRKLTEELRDIAFGDWRAETIARTETAIGYNKGAAAAYAENGVEKVTILDGPGCLPDGHDDSAGAPDDEVGVQDDAEANGQVWTVSDYAASPIGHPNCQRAAAPVVEIPTGEYDDSEED